MGSMLSLNQRGSSSSAHSMSFQVGHPMGTHAAGYDYACFNCIMYLGCSLDVTLGGSSNSCCCNCVLIDWCIVCATCSQASIRSAIFLNSAGNDCCEILLSSEQQSLSVLAQMARKHMGVATCLSCHCWAGTNVIRGRS